MNRGYEAMAKGEIGDAVAHYTPATHLATGDEELPF